MFGRVFPPGQCVELRYCEGAVFAVFSENAADFSIYSLCPGSFAWEYCETGETLSEAIEFLADHLAEWSRFRLQESLERCLKIS